MLRGLYAAACGLMAESARNDVIANNLANVNTTGFKKDAVAVRSFPEVLVKRMNDGRPAAVGPLARGTVIDEIRTYHGAGPLLSTGRSLDLAIIGSGFFVVRTPQGERYTRSGSLTVSPEGLLVDAGGRPVMGEKGPVTIDSSALEAGSLQISETGEVQAGGETIDRLRIVAPGDLRQLQKQGGSLYTLADPQAELPDRPDCRLETGFLEASNVNPVAEMVDLITAMRAFEAGSKAIQAYDATLERAVNEIARV